MAGPKLGFRISEAKRRLDLDPENLQLRQQWETLVRERSTAQKEERNVLRWGETGKDTEELLAKARTESAAAEAEAARCRRELKRARERADREKPSASQKDAILLEQSLDIKSKPNTAAAGKLKLAVEKVARFEVKLSAEQSSSDAAASSQRDHVDGEATSFDDAAKPVRLE